MKEEKTYDLIIIGGGPAGLGAAIYAAREGINSLLIERKDNLGGQIIDTDQIDNYPGISGISGYELIDKIYYHAIESGSQIINDEVTNIERTGQEYRVITRKRKIIGKTIIIATGAHYRKMNITGEDTFRGKGVSYCATCDGAFFKGKDVAVVGGGNVALTDAIILSKKCRKVYIIHRRNMFRGSVNLDNKVNSTDNIECIFNSKVVLIEGVEKVEKIYIENSDGGEKRIIPVAGIFVAIGMEPNSEVAADLVPIDENNYIVADENGITSTVGVFAAGDVRQKKLRQVITAVADGANAVDSVMKYLINTNKKG